MRDVVLTGLVHGAWLCAFMTFVVLGSLRHDPRIWQHDAPKALQEQLGPVPPATRRRRLGWVVVMMVGLVGVSALLVGALGPGAGVLERALAAYVMFEVFNLYDAVVIDLGIIVLWAPAWAFVPGTRGHPALRDWRFHVRAYLVGVVAGVPFALVVAGVAAAWDWLR